MESKMINDMNEMISYLETTEMETTIVLLYQIHLTIFKCMYEEKIGMKQTVKFSEVMQNIVDTYSTYFKFSIRPLIYYLYGDFEEYFIDENDPEFEMKEPEFTKTIHQIIQGIIAFYSDVSDDIYILSNGDKIDYYELHTKVIYEYKDFVHSIIGDDAGLK
jgi:hypothetical protein